MSDRLDGARVEWTAEGWLVVWSDGAAERATTARTIGEVGNILYELDGHELTSEDVLDADARERHRRVDEKLTAALARRAHEAAEAAGNAPVAEAVADARRTRRQSRRQPTAMGRLRRALQTLERWHQGA